VAPQRLLSFSKMNVPSSVTALGKIIFLRATDPDLLTNALVFFFFGLFLIAYTLKACMCDSKF
jgi:hypothetical protein